MRAQGGSSTGPPQPEDNSLQDETGGGKNTLWRMFDELITESQKLAGKETKYSKEKKGKTREHNRSPECSPRNYNQHQPTLWKR